MKKLPLFKFLSLRVYLWIVILIFMGGVAAYWVGRTTTKNESQNASYSTVKYIKQEDETVFLAVGIQNVETQKNNTKIPWTAIGVPLTEKKAIIILNYEAKLGISSPAKIKSTGKTSYEITIPRYSFIGTKLDKKHPYNLYDSSGELLSYSTQNIDTGALVTKALSTSKQERYLKQYTSSLDSAAQKYYTTIFKAVDPKIKLTFKFSRNS